MPRDPLANLDKGQEVTTQSTQLSDLHDHLVRLQKRVDEQDQYILSLQASIPDTYKLGVSSFEAKVWETVMMGALTASLGPNKVLNDSPKAMQQMIGRALRLADAGLDTAKAYQKDQDILKAEQEVAKNNDPLRQLIG